MVNTPYPLGRNVQHDPRSKMFRAPVRDVQVRTVRHTRHIPVLDQGQIGSCTGNAAIGALGTDPYWATVPQSLVMDEALAISVYSEATVVDDFPGSYPPDDTGSSGLGVAKALKNRGLISGYTHAFSLDDALKALSMAPVIIGVNWYDDFFTPDAAGIISVGKSGVVGGHEVVLDEVDVEKQMVGATNSWSSDWGVKGRFYIPFDLLSRLMFEDGDVTSFVPATMPAPEPVNPGEDLDQTLWNETRAWAAARHVKSNRAAAKSVAKWAAAKGLH